jgi:hypothetical protein
MKVGLRTRTRKPWAKAPGLRNTAGRLKSMEVKAGSSPQSFKRMALSPASPHSKSYGH